jgi:hypothetical protein
MASSSSAAQHNCKRYPFCSLRACLQENGFTGPLPIGRTNRQLAVLRARLNDFSGTIPLEVWELPQLMTFDVTNNRWACAAQQLQKQKQHEQLLTQQQKF